jgi:hypothetical protein
MRSNQAFSHMGQESCFRGWTTLNKMTLVITTLSIMTFRITINKIQESA